jgi:hypothetical protein
VVSAHTTLSFTLLASSAVEPTIAVILASKVTKPIKTRMLSWYSPKPSNIAGRLDSYTYGALCAGCLCYHRWHLMTTPSIIDKSNHPLASSNQTTLAISVRINIAIPTCSTFPPPSSPLHPMPCDRHFWLRPLCTLGEIGEVDMIRIYFLLCRRHKVMIMHLRV